MPGQGLRDLTGAPYDYLIGDLKNSWEFIQEGLQNKYILAASSEKSIKGLE